MVHHGQVPMRVSTLPMSPVVVLHIPELDGTSCHILMLSLFHLLLQNSVRTCWQTLV